MASYQTRAEQAIEDQRWEEAHDLLSKGIEQTPLFDNALRMELRRAALPFYRDAINYESGRASQLSDMAASEVYEQSRTVLQKARENYREQVLGVPKAETRELRTDYVGALTEQSMFVFFTYVRLKQMDEVLIVPASSVQDYTSGALAHDFGIYHPDTDWHPTPRISLQAKHQALRNRIEKYSPSVVVMGYQGKDELGIDAKAVTSPNSLSASLAGENDHDLHEKAEASYDRAYNMLVNWPEVREEALAKLAESRQFTQRMDLSRFVDLMPPEIQEA